jgi:hypothetical protein
MATRVGAVVIASGHGDFLIGERRNLGDLLDDQGRS